MKMRILSPTEIARSLGCARGTIVGAAKRADIGIYTGGEFDGKEVERLVGIAKEDMATLKAHIHDTPGNPNFGAPRRDHKWHTIRKGRSSKKKKAASR